MSPPVYTRQGEHPPRVAWVRLCRVELVMSANALIELLLETAPPDSPASTLKRAHRRRNGYQASIWDWTSWALLPAALLTAWFLTTSVFRVFSENQLPAPQQVASATAELVSTGEFFKHLEISLLRVGVGFGAGAMLGLFVGVLVGLSSPLERLLDPTLQAIRNVPSLAWVPFLLLWMGIDEAPKITLIGIGAFFPVYINTVAGVRQVDRKLLEVGYIFGSSVFKCEAEGFLTIWPGCLPGLSSPVRAPGDLRGRHPDQHPRPRQDRHRDQRDYRGGFAPRRRDHRV